VIHVLQHLLNILSGMAAVAVNLAILAVLGSAITLVTGKQKSISLATVVVPAACLVALYCWYGIKMNVPLPILLGAVLCLAVGIFTYRLLTDGARSTLVDSQLPALFNQHSSTFALFYAIAYVFLTPPVLSGHLPIATIGNHDIFNYINIGDSLQHLGPSNIAGWSLVANFYGSTPAVFPALQAMAAFLGGGIMQAALPTMLGIVALIGIVVTSITQTAFALPRSASIALAAVIISGPLFRYTSGNYFLSQLMASLILLLLLGRTLECVGHKRCKSWLLVVATFAPYYILVYFLYPIFLVIAAGLQAILVAGIYLLSARGDAANETGEARATIVRWGVGILSCLIVVAAVDPVHFQQMVVRVLELSTTNAGWAMSLMSPTAILGLPGGLQITQRTAQFASTIVFLVVTAVIGYYYLIQETGRRPVAGTMLFFIAAIASALYATYFYVSGASYQQWKFATYLPLLMSFAWWAACMSIMRAMLKSKRLADLATHSLCAILVIGNLLNYALREPPMRTFSDAYANLRALNRVGSGTELYVNMASFATTFFPVYFIRDKTLHLLSDSYYPKEQFDLANVSPLRPLFVEGAECKPDAPWSTTVVGVGCLYRQFPTIEFGSNYLLSEQWPMGIVGEGLSLQEKWGRWSDGDKVVLRLFASSADLSKAPSGFVNFRIHRYIGRGGFQRVAIRWGERNAEEVLDQPRTISLPYVRTDWKGSGPEVMTITMDLPDAISPRAVDPTSADTRKLAIGFTVVSVTSVPAGTVIGGVR
jgi:hypothetical protein